jgi:hypothetical protein
MKAADWPRAREAMWRRPASGRELLVTRDVEMFV